MPEMGRRNQRGAVIGAGRLACLRTEFEDQLQHFHIIRDGRNSDHILSVVLQSIEISARGDERRRRDH